MSYPLVSEIRRGLWALDITNLEAYTPVIEKLLAGEPLAFKDEPKASLMGIFDTRNRLKMPDDDGALDVPPNSIARVSMTGEIMKHGDFCTYGADEIVEALIKAQENPNIDATVLAVDTPGGAVSAIDIFREFKTMKTKPIVGLCDDALSLGLWTINEICDYKISNGNVSPRFGSLGVMASWTDFSKELAARGVVKVEVYAPESEHKNEAFRLAREGKFDLIKTEHLSPLAKKFQESVRAGSPNLKEEVGVMTGKTFYADDALRLGLIDAIGNINTAITKARGLALAYQLK